MISSENFDDYMKAIGTKEKEGGREEWMSIFFKSLRQQWFIVTTVGKLFLCYTILINIMGHSPFFHYYILFIYSCINFILQVLGSQPGRWAIGPSPIWCSAWTTKGRCAWRLRAPSKTPKSSSNSTSHSMRRPPTTGRRGLVRRPDGRERITARLRRFSVRGLTVYLSSVAPADRDDSGKRQACAETKLGRQRNLHRKGDLGREIDSGKIFLFFFSPDIL